ncbi:MAG: hypothetical protein Q7J54_07410 [Candidatus Woesearchaeota archaeon]|nr:hypothetical protein [Candidatus Woesearchaeota archaeon]
MTTLDNFQPRRIYVYSSVVDNDITKKILQKYEGVPMEIVETQKATEIVPTKDKSFTSVVNDAKQLLMLGTTDNFIEHFPTRDEPYCAGLTKIKPITNGCYFSCEYCYLQQTYRKIMPFIKFNVNCNDLVAQIKQRMAKGEKEVYDMGELQDSLAFDELYPLTKILVPLFAKSDSKLLLLTKSDCIDNLLDLEHNGQTIVSWSINCDFVTDNLEHRTASLDQRIEAARKVQEKGYEVRFRFDPLLMFDGWQNKYAQMVEKVLSNVSPTRITLGSFRLERGLFRHIRERFPRSILLDESKLAIITSKGQAKRVRFEDGKERYEPDIRAELYRFVIEEIKKRSDAVIALCKESVSMWEQAGLTLDKDNCKCHCKF